MKRHNRILSITILLLIIIASILIIVVELNRNESDVTVTTDIETSVNTQLDIMELKTDPIDTEVEATVDETTVVETETETDAPDTEAATEAPENQTPETAAPETQAPIADEPTYETVPNSDQLTSGNLTEEQKRSIEEINECCPFCGDSSSIYHFTPTKDLNCPYCGTWVEEGHCHDCGN